MSIILLEIVFTATGLVKLTIGMGMGREEDEGFLSNLKQEAACSLSMQCLWTPTRRLTYTVPIKSAA